MNLKGSQTEKNLWAAFAGESQARNKYTYYSSRAKKDGYEQIASLFLETAENEKEHAKIWFKILMGGEIKNTSENLSDAVNGEDYEYADMYKNFAETALQEGFKDIAQLFKLVGEIEKAHRDRYDALLKNLDSQQVFKRDGKVYWHCRNCGHIHEGDSAPELCPVCSHPKAYFELLKQNY